MDKRNLSDLFRERLKTLLQRSDLNQSAFAAAVGIDRSALSQLLSGSSTRLPRAETLLNIAAGVTFTWSVRLFAEPTACARATRRGGYGRKTRARARAFAISAHLIRRVDHFADQARHGARLARSPRASGSWEPREPALATVCLRLAVPLSILALGVK